MIKSDSKESDILRVRFEYHLPHQSGLYANPQFYCDGKLLCITIDLKPYIERRRVRLDRNKNH